MTSIVKAGEKDASLLSEIATLTFIESHGHSAKPEDINAYVTAKYSRNAFEKELTDAKNTYHILYHDQRPAGYSKIIFDSPYTGSPISNITKLERIYLLKEFYNLQLGSQLFQFNVDLSKRNNQLGIWLYVWKENTRAVDFYKRKGFLITGSHDFKISETHSNPNHQMFLLYRD
ncbi:MAG: GNAT family N-acetyltransferase [Chitinophagaceae bacterium]|nr:GNAT family N-acetyltransferase [Chitinophagaceae bacterium]